MTQRKVKVMSAVAALSIAVAGAATTAQVANAASPAAVQAAGQAQEDRGVIVLRVAKDGPAAQAGVKRGDILLKLNETDINTLGELQQALQALKPGDEVTLVVLRGEDETLLKVDLGEIDGRAYLGVVTEGAPQQTPAIPSQPAQPAQPETPAQPSAPEGQAMPFKIEPVFKVTEVVTDSPAAKAGLLKDDLILAVNGETFDMQSSLADVIKGFKPGDEVTLKIKRADKEQDLKVTLGENPDNKGAAYLGIRYGLDLGNLGSMMPNMPNNRSPRGNNGQGQQGMPFEMPAGTMQVAVGDVTKDGPADKAGLKAGDVISAVNGTQVATPDELVKLVQAAKPGDKLTLSIVRDGKDDEIVVTLGENPDKKGAGYLGIAIAAAMKSENTMPGMPNNGSPRGNNGQDQQGMPFEMPAGVMQITVGEVTKDSPAEKAGLKAGDVISAANGTAITTPDEFVKLVQAAKPGDKITLNVVRDGQDDEIEVTLGENPDKKGAGYLGISIGAIMKFDNLMPGMQGSNGEGYEIMPGFTLPFDFGNMPDAPQQAPEQNNTQS